MTLTIKDSKYKACTNDLFMFITHCDDYLFVLCLLQKEILGVLTFLMCTSKVDQSYPLHHSLWSGGKSLRQSFQCNSNYRFKAVFYPTKARSDDDVRVSRM